MSEEMHVSVFEARAMELKPGSKYLVLLKGDSIDAYHIQSLKDELKRLGFDGLVVALTSDVEVSVIEQPEEPKKPKNSKERTQEDA